MSHEDELRWWYQESAGALGLSSSLGAMINMAMSGISQGGQGAPSQHTAADFDGNSVVAKWQRIAHTLGALDPVHQAVLTAVYGEKVPGERVPLERAGESGKEHGERVSNYGPAKRCFGALHEVVIALRLVTDVAALDRDRRAVLHPLKGEKKADLAERAKDIATRVHDAKKTIERAKTKAAAAVVAAHAAYVAEAKARPPARALRSLDGYKRWLNGGVA